MKKVFSLLVATVMSLTMMVATASAADIDGIYGASAGEPSVTSISAPVGYIESVAIDAPAGNSESTDATDGCEAIGTPLVAWDFSFLDYIALEKGYMVVEPVEPKDILRTYTCLLYTSRCV